MILAVRVFVIGISASKWPVYTTSACIASCVGWTAVLYIKGDGVFAFCRDKTVSAFAPRSWIERLRALLLSCMLAVVYMFTFVNLTEGPTFCRYLVYYLICGVQNAVLIFLWFWFTDLTMEGIYYSEYLLITSVIFFIIGIGAMITYYIVFHTSVREVFSRYCPWLLRFYIFWIRKCQKGGATNQKDEKIIYQSHLFDYLLDFVPIKRHRSHRDLNLLPQC